MKWSKEINRVIASGYIGYSIIIECHKIIVFQLFDVMNLKFCFRYYRFKYFH